MTCFSHLSCWTRPWRCRKVQEPPFLDRSEAPKVHHPQVDDATIVDYVDDVDSDGKKLKKHNKIWKLKGNGAIGDLHGALGTDGYADELWPAATGGLGWVNPVP